MKRNLGKKGFNETGLEREDGYGHIDHAASPDQLAIVWNGEEEAISAFPVPGVVSGSFDMDISRLPADFDLEAALRMRRENQFDLPPISAATNFLTVVPDYSERTRILALDGEILALNDFELSEWLINAERQMTVGTDNHPIFETALDDTACSVSRLPNGLVAMTEVPRPHVNAARERLRSIFGEDEISLTNFTLETPIRAVARYFLTAIPAGAATLRAGKEQEVTAFLLIGKAGFSYCLWSPYAGLFSEYAFLAPSEISREESFGAPEKTPATGFDAYRDSLKTGDKDGLYETAGIEDVKTGKAERLDQYIKNAFDQLFLQLSPERLDQLQLTGYAQVVWATEPGLAEAVEPIAEKYSADSGLDFLRIDVPIDEASAAGLLFGSFNFGDEMVAGAEIVPPVNLARDLLILADKEEIERRRLEEVRYLRARSRAVVALWAAPVMVLACLLALTVDIVRQKIMLSIRDHSAEMRTLELKPALDRRKSYEENLKWYQEFITQVSALRKQQPVGIGMLYELNQSYPFTIDPAFYVSELKLLPTGGVEIKGLARNKDAVTSFLRSLEFAGGPESGTRMFSNLTYEVQEGVAPTAAAANGQPNAPPALTNNSLAPGITAWNIKGNYLPIAEFIPPDPTKKPGVNPAGNPAVNAANAANAAAGNAPPAAVPPPAQ